MPRLVLAARQGVADFFADGRAAGFAQGADGVAQVAQAPGQGGELRGFAAALGSFKSDE